MLLATVGILTYVVQLTVCLLASHWVAYTEQHNEEYLIALW